MDATTQAITKRYSTPFGAPRGTAATTWPDDKAFLGQPADTGTGLTHIGAREYDPAIGRFLSIDPLLETDKPQTLNGYTYSANNPATFSDPDGMGVMECMTGVITGCSNGVPTEKSTYHKDRDRQAPKTSNESAGQYPPVQAEDANRKPWGSEKPTSKDNETFYKASVFAMSYMAFMKNGNAYTLLEHWLENDGTPMYIDVTQMMNDLPSLRDNIGGYLRVGTFDSGWKSSGVVKDIGRSDANAHSVRDWYYALNGYQYRVRGHLNSKGGTLHGSVTVNVYKRYNWGNPAGGTHRADVGAKIYGHIVGPKLVQNEMAHLNTVGLAQDFDVLGEAKFNVG
ncbi:MULTISPECIES: RHS repeat-associated core domain-containing protein [unclassified Streptomyces]|uniref:RHS repeat-associated core domain-containing protein n=1 Tax=unclassified Streptomyces TaxID=2593676 RepID=UPI002E2B4D99|nr:RHS repeat-associated core domain-containing protein [Streptomyces sp. NBC_00223]